MTPDALNAVFGALADPTRRAILARLTDADLTVAELSAPFAVSQPAISRHLKVLEGAGLITRHRRATARLSHLEAEPLREATEWLARYQAFWDESYGRLDALLRALQGNRSTPPDESTNKGGTRTMTKTMITAPAGLPYVEIAREFDAPRDLVYRAHTDPELLVQWLGPRRLTMTVERFEVRDGGTWRYTHRDADGAEYGFHGVFHGTPSPDGIVQTFEFEGAPGHVSLDRLTLEGRDGGTLIRVHSTFESVADRDAMVEAGMAQGVTEGYERLDELIASLAPVG